MINKMISQLQMTPKQGSHIKQSKTKIHSALDHVNMKSISRISFRGNGARTQQYH